MKTIQRNFYQLTMGDNNEMSKPYFIKNNLNISGSKRALITAYLFLIPSLLGVLLLFVIPYVDIIRRSFMDGSATIFVGLENYSIVMTNQSFRLSATNTIFFMAVCIPLLLVLSLLISICLHQDKAIGKVFDSIFLIPMAIPVASIVLLWDVVFAKAGFISNFLGLFNVDSQNWTNTKYSFLILVFSYIWKNLGYNIVIWTASLSMISSEIYDAAKVDGANEEKCFFYITLPNLRIPFFLITTLSVINGFKVFREVYLVGGDYPEEHIYLLQHLFNNWFRDLSVNKLAAGAVMVGGVLFVLILIFQKFFDWED